MCGIAGKLIFDTDARVDDASIQAMLRPIAHRGPDGSGVYLDHNVGLGHVRLSIIDLGTGDQPMPNEDRTVWIVFNGEIYNFLELREQLIAKGHQFRSRSDTEVIIHAYEEYGTACVEKLRGMFAFAIWDQKNRRLFLARDRVGIKPLYYYQGQKSFYFASELKAIIADPFVPRDMNLGAVRSFFSFNYLPGPETLLQGILRLPPGFYMVVEDGKVTQTQYWDLKFSHQRWNMPYEEAVEELNHLLAQTVQDHMIADVPVGVLLSGGVDSSAILSYAVQQTSKKVKTFTVGFDGGGVVDERPFARSAAEKFGSEHFEITITADDFWNFLPEYVWHMEEPVCEPPAVALYYVTKLARQHVKVVLSGEGGDEAFGGYPNYPTMLRVEKLQNLLGPLARFAGATGSALGTLMGDGRLERYGYACGRPLASHYFSRTSSPVSWFNRQPNQIFTADFLAATSSSSPAALIQNILRGANPETTLDQMLFIDSKTWLPDDLLIKADKVTMANSIELRVPLLDHKVLEFAASLPPEYKVCGKETKRILKTAFAQVLPEDVLNRKKAGFPVPYAAWMRGEFKEQIREMLVSSRSIARNFLQEGKVKQLLQTNSRDGQLSKEVFSLLVLEFWRQQFIDRPSKMGRSEDSAVASLTASSR